MNNEWHPTYIIDSVNELTTDASSIEKIVLADAWNCQKRYVTADSQISGENWVTVNLEIINEYWVIADVCNRQRQLIHDRHMKSIEKNKIMSDAWNCKKRNVTADP
jgi:predicted transposase YbfD/YdcC